MVDERTRHIRSLTGAGDRPRGPARPPGADARPGGTRPGGGRQTVAAGAGVVVLEAMKMENELRASASGIVKAVHARAGETVEKGQILIEFE